MQLEGEVVNLSPADKEQMRQNLSVLVACLRVRFNATQATKWELVPSNDIEHLEICKRLAQYSDPDTLLKLNGICDLLQETIVNGHNKVKFKGYMLDDAMYQIAREKINEHMN